MKPGEAAARQPPGAELRKAETPEEAQMGRPAATPAVVSRARLEAAMATRGVEAVAAVVEAAAAADGGADGAAVAAA